jgi:hypothetical protein
MMQLIIGEGTDLSCRSIPHNWWRDSWRSVTPPPPRVWAAQSDVLPSVGNGEKQWLDHGETSQTLPQPVPKSTSTMINYTDAEVLDVKVKMASYLYPILSVDSVKTTLSPVNTPTSYWMAQSDCLLEVPEEHWYNRQDWQLT